VIRRSTGLILVLGAVMGCAGEDGTTPTTGPTTTPSPAPTPGPAPAIKSVPSKGGMSAEMTPAPAAGESKPGEAKKPGESKTNEPPSLEPPKSETPKPEAAAVKLTTEELAAIKELPAAEQDQAIKQAVCPVSNEHLGEMGKPVKVSAEGRTFFLCCDNCEKEVKANPKAVIAKLDKK
jgi:hypothetical protein